ncbi:MAG: 16S rRNA (guanine(527)-N(7))-methyltransferase RsmG [Candidatus Melainabacteria bacterium RIFCSPLOWO2_12_FULL_35_11]|nr:MAG: 16S rRNA (guanine(527)-N(7))-methyltransferase RsmG [Candidatus Melainabacteria bacterium RIFCSPLOWO2_12_FULL_35_11]
MEEASLIELKDFNDFYNACNHYGIEINNNQLDMFKKYYKILLDWNKKINLISRKGEDSIIEKHFLDSIIFLPEIENLFPSSLLDIGSGGGFPAIPLAIMKSDWDFVLCESIKKKAIFLGHLVNELNLQNKITIINDRVEMLRETSLPLCSKFDLIAARAVGKLDVLIKYAMPLLKKGGYLIAYKAKDIEDEIKDAEALISKNNLKLKIFSKKINEAERKLITIQPGYS